MNVNEIIQSSDIWKSVLELFQSNSYGVISTDDVASLSADLAAAAKIRIDEVNKGESWNESVQRLQTLIDSTYNENESDEDKANAGARGDAGANYYGNLSGDEWVQPIKNIDNAKYGDVRGTDKILSSLNYDNESQFTIGQITGNICRLIMPKYLRRVEVEDLNRNFWVIAQIISHLTNDLFDSSSPRLKILEKLLDEITQIWENIAYLWAAAGLLAKNIPTTTIWKVIPISPSCGDLLLGYKNYDDFDINWIESPQANADGFAIFQHLYTENHLKYYLDSFPNANCIFVPFVRAKNYRENFFAQLIMPGILYHDRRTGENLFFDFAINVPDLKEGNLIYIDMMEKKVKKKTVTATTTSFSEIKNFSSICTAPDDKYKNNSYCYMEVVPATTLDSYNKIKDLNGELLFVLRNHVGEMSVTAKTVMRETPVHVTNVGSKVGTIFLTFGDGASHASTRKSLPYLGDVVSYYAGGESQ